MQMKATASDVFHHVRLAVSRERKHAFLFSWAGTTGTAYITDAANESRYLPCCFLLTLPELY